MGSVHPLDADLWLPAGLHSHGLRRLAVTEAVRGSYDQAKEAIDRRCGKVLGKRQAERLVVEAARDIDSFYRSKAPMTATASTTLVLQVDGKGIVMRPEALRPATLKAHRDKKTGDAHEAGAGREAAPEAYGHAGLRVRGAHPDRYRSCE
jgi:hypothetical protein